MIDLSRINSSTDGLLQMIINLDDEAKKKLAGYYGEGLEEKIELILLIGDNYKNINKETKVLNGELEDLGYGFALMRIPIANLEKGLAIRGIQFAELPKSLYTSYAQSNNASCINESVYSQGLTGKGCVIGFIDTGIDYKHRAFLNESGDKTRVKYIFDLNTNEEWDNTELNRWLGENGIGEPPPGDFMGHGTHVAGIACGNPKNNIDYRGVAYESDIIMVKMAREGKVNKAQSSQLMRGIKYIIDKGKKLSKPLVISLSYSTNNGSHDGRSLLELYISTITSLERVTFVCAAGNMGDRGLHKGGILKAQEKVDVSIGGGERGLVINLFRDFFQELSLEIKNPSGVKSGNIVVNKTSQSVFLGRDKIIIHRNEANPYNLRGAVIISIISEDKIQSGVWSIILKKDDNKPEKYSMWLPIGDGLSVKTKFLQPTLEDTLGIPATVSNIISVGSYNSSTNTASSFSGRGRLNSFKPEIAAPGENIISSVPDNGYDSYSGTSMATPQVAGACALLMEWGIVKGNDNYMYGERVKYFLIRGAKRKRMDVDYPNNQWGYGTLCLENSLEIAKGEKNRMRVTGIEEAKFGKVFKRKDYENYIVEYDDGMIEKVQNLEYASALKLDSHRAIISVKKGYLNKLLREVKDILYVEKSSLYTLNSSSAIEKANITYFHDSPYLTLRGGGVLVGIVDTGIDYLHDEFIYEDDTSKIVSIWDQEGEGKNTPDLIGFGEEFKRDSINNAIKAKREKKDPYKIVATKDNNGHGTQMAGIIAGRGKEDKLKGAAPDSELVVVKLKKAKNTLLKNMGVPTNKNAYDSVDIILGIKYLIDIAKKQDKPIVIYIPLGTNRGAHDGSSLLERYVDEIAKVRGVAVVTGTGNNGDTATHTSGQFKRKGEIKNIELKVGEKQRNLSLQIWGKKPDKLSFGLISPSGEIIDKIPAKLMETEEVKFVFEGSSVFITYSIPEEITGDELIDISIFNIKPGIWQLRLFGDFIVDGNYDIWLPQRELLEEGTEFLSPSPYITAMVPSTARRILACSAYDQSNNSILSASGRGETRDGRVIPHVAAGGVNVETTQAGGGSTAVYGSSAASAVLAGSIALLLEWGIVLGNDKTMYSTKIKTYLIRGTNRRKGDIYPNNVWGYGTLNMMGVFENIRGADGEIEDFREHHEKDDGKMFIRMPKDILF